MVSARIHMVRFIGRIKAMDYLRMHIVAWTHNSPVAKMEHKMIIGSWEALGRSMMMKKP